MGGRSLAQRATLQAMSQSRARALRSCHHGPDAYDLATDLTSMVATDCEPCSLVAATDTDTETDTPPSTTRVPWSGIIGVEGELTGDGRYIEHNALRWENLPLPMRYV